MYAVAMVIRHSKCYGEYLFRRDTEPFTMRMVMMLLSCGDHRCLLTTVLSSCCLSMITLNRKKNIFLSIFESTALYNDDVIHFNEMPTTSVLGNA